MGIDRRLAGELQEAAAALGAPLDSVQIDRFFEYLALIQRWHSRARLTTITAPEGIVRLHFIDSLLCLRPGIPQAASVIDVGSGAGLPGIPLKIARPDLRVTLLEASGRRAAFLEHAAEALRLGLTVVALRAEIAGHLPGMRARFDAAVARAVAPLAVLAELTLPFVAVSGRAILLKGPRVQAELESGQKAVLRLGGDTPAVIWERLPRAGERRAVVVIAKTAPTPEEFPRRAGVPGRRPLAG